MIASYGEQLLDWLETYTFPTERAFADKAHAGEVAEVFLNELLRNGFEPSSFLRYLDRLGRIETLQTLAWAVPDLHALDAEACYLGYELTLRSAASMLS